jgi:hypothetical protein
MNLKIQVQRRAEIRIICDAIVCLASGHTVDMSIANWPVFFLSVSRACFSWYGIAKLRVMSHLSSDFLDLQYQ